MADETKQSRVDLVDRPRVLIGILFLDDGGQRPLVVLHDPAVAPGVIQNRRQDCRCTSAFTMVVDELSDGFRSKARHISVQHDHRTGEALEGLLTLHHSVARAELRLLLHKMDAAVRAGFHYLIRPIPNHDVDPIARNRLNRIDHVGDHRTLVYGVQHLGQIGGHSGAFARGEDNRCN